MTNNNLNSNTSHIENHLLKNNILEIDDFEKLLINAIKKCKGEYVEDFSHNFSLIYPFTTENIAGYINQFDLNDKTLLTVGSSGDQIINGILYGCKSITSLDVNPYTKFYTYLKLSCILEIQKDEFLKFLCFKDYSKYYRFNPDIFNIKTYKKIKQTLSLLDYESYLIWDSLFQSFEGKTIRNELFASDESELEVILKCNPYLQSEISYQEIREKIKKTYLNFIIGDLFKIDIKGKFNNIWLSNIGTYFGIDSVKEMTKKMSSNLNDDGKLLISYLYRITKDSKYNCEFSNIYNLEKAFEILNEYNPDIISFLGMDGIKNNNGKKDSVLIYKK